MLQPRSRRGQQRADAYSDTVPTLAQWSDCVQPLCTQLPLFQAHLFPGQLSPPVHPRNSSLGAAPSGHTRHTPGPIPAPAKDLAGPWWGCGEAKRGLTLGRIVRLPGRTFPSPESHGAHRGKRRKVGEVTSGSRGSEKRVCPLYRPRGGLLAAATRTKPAGSIGARLSSCRLGPLLGRNRAFLSRWTLSAPRSPAEPAPCVSSVARGRLSLQKLSVPTDTWTEAKSHACTWPCS